MAKRENWNEILRSNYTELLKNIDTEHGLYGELQKERIFTPIALKSFWDCKDTTGRLDQMLRNLQRKDFEAFQKFCTALEKSDQVHIVDMYLSTVKDVKGKSVTDSTDPTESRGIPHAHLRCLKQNWNDLICCITFDEGLMAEMDKRNICTTIQLNTLKDIHEEAKRTEKFLRLLDKGSEKQYSDFCMALTATNQSHIITKFLTPQLVSNTEKERLTAKVCPFTAPLEETPENPPDNTKDFDPSIASGNPGQNSVKEISVENIVFSPCSEDFRKCINEKVRLQAAYKSDSNPRGRAVIINNQYFTRENLEYRHGADKDSCNLETFFKRLQFDTVVHLNDTAEDIMKILREESKADCHKDYDMFVLFLMSHGIQGEIYGLDGRPVKTKEIMQLFDGNNCPNLVGKPKLIFIQACQGDLKTTGVTAGLSVMTVTDAEADPVWNITAEDVVEKLKEREDFNISLPLEPLSILQSDAIPDVCKIHEMADMALFYATVEGYAAWRRKDIGSLFVQCLINVFMKGAHEKDLMSMFTEVSAKLHDYEVNEDGKSYKQIGEKRDTLRKLVYLLPG